MYAILTQPLQTIYKFEFGLMESCKFCSNVNYPNEYIMYMTQMENLVSNNYFDQHNEKKKAVEKSHLIQFLAMLFYLILYKCAHTAAQVQCIVMS